ncbi:MAG: DUF6175 family protein [Flavobacteriales bacterium]
MKRFILSCIAVLAALSATTALNAQNEPWFETDPFKAVELWGDTKGDYIKVDVTCSAPTVPEALLEARKLALYTYIFVGFDAAVTKLAESSVYEQDKDFFIAFINEEGKGLRYAEGKINTSKPGGEVKIEKKKMMKITTSVTLKIAEIRKDLESQGKIKSMADLRETLGEITVVVRPNDEWLKRLGGYSEEDNQGTPAIKRDYSKLSLNKDYNHILQSIRVNLGDGFKIEDINTQLANNNNEVMRDKLSDDVDLQESAEDMLARTLQADIYLELNFTEESVDGGTAKQMTISFTGIDAYSNSSSDMPGRSVTKRIVGDNKTALMDAALKEASNDFQAKALKFLVKREEKGLAGKIIFKVDAGVDLNFSSKINVGGDKMTFSELIDEAAEELASKASPFGQQTSTRREYDVTIPSKTKNRKGKEVSNSFEKLASKIETYVTEELKDLQAVVKTVGKGKVVVVFKPAE